MRDGVRLATDIRLPEVAGPFPTILERTPYGRDRTGRSERTAAHPMPVFRAELVSCYATRGDAVVFQDTRSRHGSEGRFIKPLSDAEKGYDSCARPVRQPRGDGRICTMGHSCAAHTQAALRWPDAPGTAGQVRDRRGFADAWRAGIGQSRPFELGQAAWAYKRAILSPEAAPTPNAALESEDSRDWLTPVPWRPGCAPLRHHPDCAAYLLDQSRHGAFDEFWQQPGIWAEGFHGGYSKADCVHLPSWFDPYPARRFVQ